ncbi:MAG: hypothetical protein SPL80_09300 [Bacilli bacterium]|nr:hypothetical protein [Bacilli bacterium]
MKRNQTIVIGELVIDDFGMEYGRVVAVIENDLKLLDIPYLESFFFRVDKMVSHEKNLLSFCVFRHKRRLIANKNRNTLMLCIAVAKFVFLNRFYFIHQPGMTTISSIKESHHYDEEF